MKNNGLPVLSRLAIGRYGYFERQKASESRVASASKFHTVGSRQIDGAGQLRRHKSGSNLARNSDTTVTTALTCQKIAHILSSYVIRMIHRCKMGRIKVNLTLDADVANAARELGLNMSRLAEAAISDAAKLERNRVWREENKAAIDTYAEEVEREGLALSRFRSF